MSFKVLAAIVASEAVLSKGPISKVGATIAGRELSLATANLVDLDLAVMWDCDETFTIGKLTVRHCRTTTPLNGITSRLPGRLRVPLLQSKIPQLIRDGDYDIVHIQHVFPAFAAEEIARAARSKGIPYVISSHGFYEQSRYAELHEFGRLKTAIAEQVFTRPFRHVVAQADGIFALSDREGDLLRSLRVEPERVHVVTNGVTEFYLEEPAPEELESTKQKFGIGPGPVLLYMGHHHKYKGMDVFLQSLSQLQGPFQAVVAGRFRSERENEELLERADLSEREKRAVTFTGGISDAELRALYHLAERLCISHPRRHAALGGAGGHGVRTSCGLDLDRGDPVHGQAGPGHPGPARQRPRRGRGGELPAGRLGPPPRDGRERQAAGSEAVPLEGGRGGSRRGLPRHPRPVGFREVWRLGLTLLLVDREGSFSIVERLCLAAKWLCTLNVTRRDRS